jgi:hypothetical protein
MGKNGKTIKGRIPLDSGAGFNYDLALSWKEKKSLTLPSNSNSIK